MASVPLGFPWFALTGGGEGSQEGREDRWAGEGGVQGGRCEERGLGAAEPSEWVQSAVVCGCGGLQFVLDWL